MTERSSGATGSGRARVLLAYATALVLLVGAILLVWLLLGRQRAEEQWVRHTDSVLLHLDALLSDIVDSETAERGFVISGESSFLEPYNEAKQHLARDLDELKTLTGDNAAQQERLAGVAAVARAELAAFERVISLRRTDTEAAMAAIAGGGDKQLTDDVRARVGEMRREELRLLDARQQAAARTSRRTVVIVLAVLGCALFGLAWAAWTTQLSVTRRRLAEQESARLEATVQLDHERRARDSFREQFLGIVGHDLRSPISAISIEAQMLRQPQDATAQRETGERILTAADRMSRMVSQLLDVTRTRLGGGIPITKRETDLCQIVRQVAQESSRLHPDRITLDAPASLVGEFDPDRIAQAVSNLVRNALQHGTGPVRVSVEASEAEATLRVQNGGEPIPADKLPRIFDAFQRGHGESEGLGLGLFITSEIVQRHDGTIAVRSTREAGTTFTITLPRTARR